MGKDELASILEVSLGKAIPRNADAMAILSNYFSTYILVEKQIELKKQLQSDLTTTQQTSPFSVQK